MSRIVRENFKSLPRNRLPGHKDAKKAHEEWLRKNGVHPEQLKARRRKWKALSKAEKSLERLAPSERPDYSGVGVTGAKKEPQQYTGQKLLGIAVMHKSSLQPVFSKQAAKDSATMRRGEGE